MAETSSIEWTDATWSPWEGCTQISPACDHCYAKRMNDWLRNLFDQRIFPSIDINKSGTRRDDLLLNKEDLIATVHLRRTLAALDNDKAITLLIDRLKNTKTNEEFIQIVQRSSRQSQS